jgi:hypothetical protein
LMGWVGWGNQHPTLNAERPTSNQEPRTKN